jgi:hypothetical protein
MPDISWLQERGAYANGDVGELFTESAQVPELLLDQRYAFVRGGHTGLNAHPQSLKSVPLCHKVLMTYIDHVSLVVSV